MLIGIVTYWSLCFPHRSHTKKHRSHRNEDFWSYEAKWHYPAATGLSSKEARQKGVPKVDKAMLLRSVAVRLIDRNIIKIVEGDGNNIQKKDIAKVSTFNVFCN